MNLYIWYCARSNQLFTTPIKPVNKNRRHVVYVKTKKLRIYLTKYAFYIGRL